MNDHLYLEIEREGKVAALIFLYILIVYYIGGRQTRTPSIIQYTWEKKSWKQFKLGNLQLIIL